MAKKTDECIVSTCRKEVVYKEAGLCAACYQYMHYWGKKSVTERLQHQRKLVTREERLEMMGSNRRGR